MILIMKFTIIIHQDHFPHLYHCHSCNDQISLDANLVQSRLNILIMIITLLLIDITMIIITITIIMIITQMPLDVDRGIELPQLELTHNFTGDCTTAYSTGLLFRHYHHIFTQ